jgi:DNA-binding MarR family transcriptional regulator
MMLAQKTPTSMENEDQGMQQGYLRTLMLVERLHRQLLDVVKDELDRMRRDDINSVQALLLFNIGDDELTAGELRTRGHYLGSNVSYNLKKLVDGGYLSHQRSDKDKRAVRVRLTEEGSNISRMVGDLFDRQLKSLGPVANLAGDELERLNGALMRLERFWTDHIRYRL